MLLITAAGFLIFNHFYNPTIIVLKPQLIPDVDVDQYVLRKTELILVVILLLISMAILNIF